jgi:hypothetical protein
MIWYPFRDTNYPEFSVVISQSLQTPVTTVPKTCSANSSLINQPIMCRHAVSGPSSEQQLARDQTSGRFHKPTDGYIPAEQHEQHEQHE